MLIKCSIDTYIRSSNIVLAYLFLAKIWSAIVIYQISNFQYDTYALLDLK